MSDVDKERMASGVVTGLAQSCEFPNMSALTEGVEEQPNASHPFFLELQLSARKTISI